MRKKTVERQKEKAKRRKGESLRCRSNGLETVNLRSLFFSFFPFSFPARPFPTFSYSSFVIKNHPLPFNFAWLSFRSDRHHRRSIHFPPSAAATHFSLSCCFCRLHALSPSLSISSTPRTQGSVYPPPFFFWLVKILGHGTTKEVFNLWDSDVPLSVSLMPVLFPFFCPFFYFNLAWPVGR